VIGSQPLGTVQTAVACTTAVAIGNGVDVSVETVSGWVGDGIGDANSTENVVGNGVGVGGGVGADVSASANEMPPITSRSENIPMINPLPIWRRAFMLSSPYPVCLWRSAIVR